MRSLRLFIAAATAVLLVAGAQPAFAGKPAPESSQPKSKTHTAKRHAKPRAYGAPIQPPIVKKARTKRGHAHAVKSAEAQRKTRAAAVRRRKANEEYRRQHPASADPPR
jgi:hypothetical protein